MGTCYGRLTTGHQGELKQHTKGACFPTAGARRRRPSNDTSTPQQTPRPWRPERWAEETQKCRNLPELGSEDARHPAMFPLSALPISRPPAAQDHFQVQRQKRTEGLLRKEASGRGLEQSAQLSMRTQYLLPVLLKRLPHGPEGTKGGQL